MTLIDVVVGTALMLVTFLALFGILRASLILSSFSKAEAGATAIAQVQMEYLRGLSYSALGTVGGIPAGNVTEYVTTTEDGITYTTHTFIVYIDDPADGLGAADTNGITTDYKRANVTVSYTLSGQTRSVTLVSNFSPPGIETTTNGGTLQINAVTATGAPLAGATVAVTDAATIPAINLTAFSNASGTVSFPGAATSSAYQITVSKLGYSTAQTYARDANNQNPTPGYLTVVQNQTTTGTFAIDQLATLTVNTFTPAATSTFSDSFADASKLASMSSTTVASGALTLAAGKASGSALSVATSSASISSWGQLNATTNVPANTSALLHIYDGNGVLVPDAALAGNAAGFTSFPVNLSGISTTTYPALAIGANLATTGSTSPQITNWSLSLGVNPLPLANAQFILAGAKTIGTTGAGAPIYKTIVVATTSSTGAESLPLEWDSYALSGLGKDLVDSCPSPPFAIAAGTSPTVALYLGPSTANSLRVSVADDSGVPVAGASVTLARSGYSKTVLSSACGNAYFGSIASANDYTVTIAKSGYTTTPFTSVSVAGMSTFGASFP